MFVMVKPSHITEGRGRWKRTADMGKDDTFVRNPDEFFRTSRDLGARFVVASRRENMLAQLISSYELTTGFDGDHKTDHKKFRNITGHFERSVNQYNDAVRGAMKAGFEILPTSFNEIVGDLCGTTQRIAKAANCTCYKCLQEVQHTGTSRREKTPENRIGRAAWASVKAQLSGTPYEWMLDLKASWWPKGVRRPIELAIYPKSMSPADIAGDGSKVSWGATRQLEEEKGTRKKRRQKSAR